MCDAKNCFVLIFFYSLFKTLEMYMIESSLNSEFSSEMNSSEANLRISEIKIE